MYIEYFMKRGLSVADLFTRHLPFEPYPMALYILIMIFDGLLYLSLENIFRRITSENSSMKQMSKIKNAYGETIVSYYI